ncbi:2OG-Fe(II) oxygenase [Alteriqipengyuania sp. 357]
MGEAGACPIKFALSPDLDSAALAEEFAARGRVVIDGFLADGQAEALHELLKARQDWKQVLNSGDKLVELDRETRRGLTGQQRSDLDDAVYAGARYGFQYRYETIRVPDDAKARRKSDDPLAAFASWLSDGEPRAFLREVIGEPAVRFADAQATAFSPGDFLTGHDDAVEGKSRFAAYVLGLTPAWREEWGGLLLFHPDGTDEGRFLVPGLNRLNIFAVGQPHSVSLVSKATPVRRYSITGWLRS